MPIKLLFIFSLILIMTSTCKTENTPQDFQLKTGYILFQDLDCGPLCDAIEAVTQGYKGAQLSHMGIVVQNKDAKFVVLEAISSGVVETPINEFLSRSSDSLGNPKVIVAELKDEFKSILPLVLDEKEKYLGLPYNNEYLLNDSSFYCSQLIYTLFKIANDGEDFFELAPMTFKQPKTEDYFKAWKDYYLDLGCEIPEGKPGINPGGISRSDKIEFIYYYGLPDGLSD